MARFSKAVVNVFNVASKRIETELKKDAPAINAVQDSLASHISAGKSGAHNTDNITGLNTLLAGKASSVHTHGINQIVDLQYALDNKSNVFIGYTGSITVVTSVDFTSQVSATKTLTYTNGILVSIS